MSIMLYSACHSFGEIGHLEEQNLPYHDWADFGVVFGHWQFLWGRTWRSLVRFFNAPYPITGKKKTIKKTEDMLGSKSLSSTPCTP